jgi:hypothetical protein
MATNNGKLKYVRVYYSNGKNIPTEMNPNLTDAQIRNYYRVGKSFNVGVYPKEVMAKVTKVVIHRER